MSEASSHAVCALLSLFFVVKWVRETKGKELEDMDDFMQARPLTAGPPSGGRRGHAYHGRRANRCSALS